jgi:RNA polymerase sigma-70 factor (ECF subfamily)
MNNDQAHLITGLREGNRQVYKEIFDSYYVPLCHYCMQRIYSQEDAEEIVQDIFVKLWVKRAELSIIISLRAYLYRTALNRIINYGEHLKVRKTHQENLLSSEIGYSQDGSLFAQKEIQLLAAQAVSSMPEKRKQVYELSRTEGLKYTEIADRLNVSVKTVEAHLTKALEHMRLHLRDYLTTVFFACILTCQL